MKIDLHYPKISLTNHTIFNEIKDESQTIGYYDLVHENLEPLKKSLDEHDFKQKQIAIIGIGGSTLGTYAIYNFLKYKKKKENTLKKELFFLESTDPIILNAILNELDLEDTLFLIISKSGSTIETISIFKYWG